MCATWNNFALTLFGLVVFLRPTAATYEGSHHSEHHHTANTGHKIGLVLALYNANVTTDWLTVGEAAERIPIRAIVPVDGVSPPDPDLPPTYPTPEAYRQGVQTLRSHGVEVSVF